MLLTEEDDMYAHLISLLRDVLSLIPRPVVRIVDDDLSASVKEVPDDLFTSFQDLLPQFKSFLALSR